MTPILYIVVPCLNEQEVLPVTAPLFCDKLGALIRAGRIASESRVLFVDDGSRDQTWRIIRELSQRQERVEGISLSRNRGHQNALLAGLMEAKDRCDVTVSIDCDGQDDLNAVDAMLTEYENGSDVVYGVRSSRRTDTLFKRATAQGYYRLLNALGGEVVYNHADYRLASARALEALARFGEVNLFLRGMFPLVGFRSSCVCYERTERLAGKSKYSLKKMLSLAFDGITSLSVRPIRFITAFGFFVALISLAGIVWSVVTALLGDSVAGWASLVSIICFLGGIQLVSLGIIGEYIGKIYLEAKRRPRYIIAEKTEDFSNR